MVKHVPNPTQGADTERTCDVLFDLYEGATGTVRLGRILRGRDAGRLVLLRPIERRVLAKTRPLIERVRQLAHPKLLKVMGCHRVGEQDYVASEYIAGASLLELKPRLLQGTVRELGALVRILHDALLAAHSGRRLLEGIYGYRVERSLYPDTIWVAEFGETFLTELAIFESLQIGDAGSGVRGAPYLEEPTGGCPSDVRAAGSLLFEQLSQPSHAKAVLGLPTQTNKALANAVNLALADGESAGFKRPLAMAGALRDLMPGLSTTTDDVRSVMKRALETTLDLRREKLRLLEQNSLVVGDDDCTRFHRATGLEQAGDRETVRPSSPVGSGVHPTQPLAAGVPVVPAPLLPRLSQAGRTQPPFQGKVEGSPSPQRRTAQHARPPRAGLGPDDTPTVVPPAHGDDETTVWVRPVTVSSDPSSGTLRLEPASPPALDEDATAVYMATREQPQEPSVIIQDHDETNLYLRAKTEPGSAFERAEPTTLSDRRLLEALRPGLRLRRLFVRVVGFLLLLLVSLAVTWHFSR